jgi:flagellar basal-body rod modification protein FlgD
MSIVTAPILPAGANRMAAATTPTAAATTSSANANNTLTQADFLNIMVAQFENQDPLSSSDGSGSSGTSDYVNELMSMTNLTTMQTMSQQQSMELAGTLPGSTVELSVNGSTVSGVVENASIQNATLTLTINGTQYPASDLVSITQTQAQAQAAAANAANTGTTSTPTTPAPSS